MMKPEKLGRYEIVGELGKGAMGLVYLARDPIIGRELAIKTFRLGFSAKDADAEQFKARFLREAQSAGILSHPNIVTIHDVVVDDGGEFFIAMEYVKGTDLKRYVQEKGRLDSRFVVDIVAQIADGLDYAHKKGVVHRD
ncbi:MAG: serine/threonine-protein kinase, partial [Acidobacteriota bacterium]